MSYTIKKTNGTTLATIEEGDIDTTSASVTFIGRTAINYGGPHNENFLHLAENFANSTAPLYPMEGQLWFDTTLKKMKVYKDGTWSALGGGVDGDGGTGGGMTTIYYVTIGSPATSVMVFIAGGEIVMVIASVNVPQASLPISLTIDGTVFPFRARFPQGLEAGSTLAVDPDDYVFKGNTITQTDTSYVAGGGTPLAAVTFIDLGADSILLNLAGDKVISAYSEKRILQSALPATTIVNGQTIQVQSAFPNGLGADEVVIVDPPLTIPERGGLTMADGYGVTLASTGGGGTEWVSQSQLDTALATAIQGIYTWVDEDSAVALAITDLHAEFTTATGTTTIADALQVLMSSASPDAAIAEAITDLKAEFTTALGTASFAAALTKLNTTATNTAANSSSITNIQSTFTSVTGQTTFASAVETMWTQATAGTATATWGVKLDTGNPTYVVGIEAISNPANNVGQFKVMADKFVVTHPTDTNPIPPFYIQGGITYIRSAKILNGDISTYQVVSQSSTVSLPGTSTPYIYAPGGGISFATGAIPAGSRLFVEVYMDCRQTGGNDDHYLVKVRRKNGGAFAYYLNGGINPNFNFAQLEGITQSFLWTDDSFSGSEAVGYDIELTRRNTSTDGGAIAKAVMMAWVGKK